MAVFCCSLFVIGNCCLRAGLYGPKEPCVIWGQDWTNPFAVERGVKTAMRPFAKLLSTLVRKHNGEYTSACL